ncbi:MAG: hypothetical protein HY294_10230 [Candidatus Rokubacteria bacterium]|nr:hypothetical protein [Candidatus Rokubacteria bacterium]MBI3826362.1 hypothetical protein [Candidatus Rokubacteria bacterium]
MPVLMAVGLVAVGLSGCATTREGRLGALAGGANLVTLTVTENLDVVRRECNSAITLAPLYGCQRSRVVSLPDGGSARAVTIVRYTDAAPSSLAFEIDLHELCHAVAALQPLRDPCHDQNGGVLSSATPATFAPAALAPAAFAR